MGIPYSEEIGDDNFLYDVVIQDRVRNIPEHHKTPFSAALGIEKVFNRNKLMITAEYFAPIAPYRMVEAEPSPNSVNPPELQPIFENKDFLSVVAGAEEVFNFALGYEHQLNETLELLLGFRTDFHYRLKEIPQEFNGYLHLNELRNNQYHLTCGVSKIRKNSRFSVGLNIMYAENTNQEPFAGFVNPKDFDPTFQNSILEGDTDINSVELLYLFPTIIIGFTHNFED